MEVNGGIPSATDSGTASNSDHAAEIGLGDSGSIVDDFGGGGGDFEQEQQYPNPFQSPPPSPHTAAAQPGDEFSTLLFEDPNASTTTVAATTIQWIATIVAIVLGAAYYYYCYYYNDDPSNSNQRRTRGTGSRLADGERIPDDLLLFEEDDEKKEKDGRQDRPEGTKRGKAKDDGALHPAVDPKEEEEGEGEDVILGIDDEVPSELLAQHQHQQSQSQPPPPPPSEDDGGDETIKQKTSKKKTTKMSFSDKVRAAGEAAAARRVAYYEKHRIRVKNTSSSSCSTVIVNNNNNNKPNTNTNNQIPTSPDNNMNNDNNDTNCGDESQPQPEQPKQQQQVDPSEQRVDPTPNKDEKTESKTAAKNQGIAVNKKKGPRIFQNESNQDHPGLRAFWNWYDIEGSLFRVYVREQVKNDRDDKNNHASSGVAYYCNPSSRRGSVPIHMQVTNACMQSHRTLTAYWIDYQGREIPKGDFAVEETWRQATYVDHPWIFREKVQDEDGNDGLPGPVVLQYIPYRAIPTTDRMSTIDPDDPNVGIHRFTIRDPIVNTTTTTTATTTTTTTTTTSTDTNTTRSSLYRCIVDDPIFPYPACDTITTIEQALEYTMEYCIRMGYTNWELVIKYLTKIVNAPDQIQYRQIRIANSFFYYGIWNTPARGFFLALGFVETTNDGHLELGCRTQPLSRPRVQQISQLLYQLERQIQQPNP